MATTSAARRACSGRAWVQATTPYRLACATANAPCALCGGRISYTAHHNHRLAFTVDHITPLWAGGSPLDPANWQPSHRGCNSQRGAREGNQQRAKQRPKPIYFRRTDLTW